MYIHIVYYQHVCSLKVGHTSLGSTRRIYIRIEMRQTIRDLIIASTIETA